MIGSPTEIKCLRVTETSLNYNHTHVLGEKYVYNGSEYKTKKEAKEARSREKRKWAGGRLL